LKEERRLGVFENRVLRTEFGPKRNKLTEGWIRLHNEELYTLYSSPNNIRVIKSRRICWAGLVLYMGRQERFIQGKPEGKKPLGKPRRR
jgi:hypothetical protein